MSDGGITSDALRDKIVAGLVLTAEYICSDTVNFDKANYNARDRKIDSILTNKWTGFPIMLALLMGVFWLTITGANYPSQLISDGLFWIQDRLTDVFQYIGAPDWLHGMLPPYRKPQIGKVIVRSIFDRTLFVLGRAVVVAAPAGLIIWIMANISLGNMTLLAHCSSFLDPFAKTLGMDGVILLAFILRFSSQ